MVIVDKHTSSILYIYLKAQGQNGWISWIFWLKIDVCKQLPRTALTEVKNVSLTYILRERVYPPVKLNESAGLL